MTSFGDHGMDGELRELADRYAAAMATALYEVFAECAGAPIADVESRLTDRLGLAGVPFDRNEVGAYAQQISDGTAPQLS